MKNTLLSVALTFCFLHLITIADAQRDRSFFKDSVRYNAYKSAISFAQSLDKLKKDSTYIANFELLWWKHNDTSQINDQISVLNRHVRALIKNVQSEKDSARLNALRARMDILQSAYANAKSGWKDSSQIKALKSKIAANAQNKKIIFSEKGSIVVPRSITESQINNMIQDGLREKSKFNIFKDSAQYKAFKSYIDPTLKVLAKANEKIYMQRDLVLKELAKAQSKNFSSYHKVWPLDSSQIKELKEIAKAQTKFFRGGDLSQLTLKKSFKGESIETVKKFSITESSEELQLVLNGKVESGIITITLTKPDGSKFKSIEIDSSSDVNFEQTLSLKKTSMDWIGDWQIKVQTRKANGDYLLNILTR